MPTQEERIQQMAAEVERISPKEPARVRIKIYGGGADESRLEANRAGYLRLAAECLKATYAPFSDASGKEPYTVRADWRELFTDDSDVQIDWLERREDFVAPSVNKTIMDRVVPAVFGLVVFAGIVFAVIGVVVTLIWLF